MRSRKAKAIARQDAASQASIAASIHLEKSWNRQPAPFAAEAEHEGDAIAPSKREHGDRHDHQASLRPRAFPIHSPTNTRSLKIGRCMTSSLDCDALKNKKITPRRSIETGAT
jgi:hypothetical protein